VSEEALKLLRQFEDEWYPSKDIPSLRDFVGWLDTHYKVRRKDDGK